MTRMSRRVGSWAVAVVLWACHGDAVSGAQSASAQAQQTQGAGAKSGTLAQELVNAYLHIQSTLVKDDVATTKAGFVRLNHALKAKGLGLSPALSKKFSSAAAQGVAASTLPAARVAFAALTEAMLTYLGTAKNPLKATLTVAHCPMALDNKGAKWLQLGEKLENPYFGSEMLRCGTVDKKVQPGTGL